MRGNVVPLVDLQRKLAMPDPEDERDVRIIVTGLEIEGDPTLVGINADVAYEVVDAAWPRTER